MVWLFACLLSSSFAASSDAKARAELRSALDPWYVLLIDIDEELAGLRAQAQSNPAQFRHKADMIIQYSRTLESQWREIESFFAQRRSEGLFSEFLKEEREQSYMLRIFLAIQRAQLRRDGHSLRTLLQAWRGLEAGEKDSHPPEDLAESFLIGGHSIAQGDLILIHTLNGGVVRGHMIGWDRRGDLYIEEALPGAFIKHQKSSGMLRAVDAAQMARVEIYHPARFSNPIHRMIDKDGDYAEGMHSTIPVVRVELQLSDGDLAVLMVKRRWLEITKFPAGQVTVINHRQETRPKYAPILFLDCSELLR